MAAASGKLTQTDLSGVPYNQGHLFAGLSEAGCASVVDQLNALDGKLPGGGLVGYLERARKLLAEAKSGSNPFAGLVPSVPAGTKLTGKNGPGSAEYAELERVGADQLDRVAFCLVAGGLGERLGYPGIKIGITAEVTTGTTFIQMYCKFILAFQEHARRSSGNSALELPLAIMTSGDTHEQTVELMSRQRNFGLSPSQVTLMRQEKVPALQDVEARIACSAGRIETKPHGHGDVHALLHEQGLTQRWADEGREWLVLFQDTNPLPFRSLCAVLGVSARNSFVMNSVAVPRLPGEAVGGIAQLTGVGQELTLNVEYNQLGPLLRETPAGGDVADSSGFSPYPGNINILVFRIPDMVGCLASTGGIVPEFVNPKWADESKSKFKSPTRLECMMQDFPRLCKPSHRIGFTMLDRNMCFTCVKNNLADAAKKRPPDCALSAEADIYSSNATLLGRAAPDVVIEAPEAVSFLGISARIGARIIMQPSFAISLEDMKRRVKGKIRISNRSALVISGDVMIDGLDLDGALVIKGPGVFKDVVVRNGGVPLQAIPQSELASQPPSLRIRGYRAAAGDSCVLRKGALPETS